MTGWNGQAGGRPLQGSVAHPVRAAGRNGATSTRPACHQRHAPQQLAVACGGEFGAVVLVVAELAADRYHHEVVGDGGDAGQDVADRLLAFAISRHQLVTLPRGGRPSVTAVPSADWASSARERAAARTVRDQGSGSEPPTSLANTLIALSMSDRCACPTCPASLATSLGAGAWPRRRAASRAGGQPM